MGTHTVIKSEEFDCAKCGKVTFRYGEIQFSNDVGVYAAHPDMGQVHSYGKCPVAQSAQVPGRPTYEAMKRDCPVFQELDKR